MGAKLYFKCPGNDPVTRAVPELFACPDCGTEIEIWTDETKGKCTSCNTLFQKNDTVLTMGKKNLDKMWEKHWKNWLDLRVNWVQVMQKPFLQPKYQLKTVWRTFAENPDVRTMVCRPVAHLTLQDRMDFENY